MTQGGGLESLDNGSLLAVVIAHLETVREDHQMLFQSIPQSGQHMKDAQDLLEELSRRQSFINIQNEKG